MWEDSESLPGSSYHFYRRNDQNIHNAQQGITEWGSCVGSTLLCLVVVVLLYTMSVRITSLFIGASWASLMGLFLT
jgi:hypothetical protein